MRPSDDPLISGDAIASRVAELGREIAAHYAGRDFLAIVVLKGALMFAADLLRAMPCAPGVDFIRARSYAGECSGGRVQLLAAPSTPLEGRNVLLIEDILDTGCTAAAIRGYLLTSGVADLRICTLLDKPSRRETPIEGDHTGFTIDGRFVVGYGMDLDEAYRTLPAIHVLEPES
jgi:hypoxanthine phosphoribosyltransferase